ncbi:MAG: TAXI family TRAP transporter solute-binding subunit [Pseudomonadota bacterium]
MKTVAVIATTLVAAALLAHGGEAQIIGMGAGQQGSQNYQTNATIAKLLTEEAKLEIRVQSHGGSGIFMPLIDGRELDMAAVVVPEVYDAMQGEGPFAGRAHKNLRVVATLVPTRVGFFVRADSPIKTMADVRGKRLTHGLTAQPSLTAQIAGLLANGGLTLEDVRPVLTASVVRGVDDFIAGNSDVAFFSLAGGKLREADSAVGGVRFLSQVDTQAAIAAMQKFVPSSYLTEVKPSPGQPAIPVPTMIMTYDYLLIAGTHVADDLIYKVARTLAENREKMAAGFAMFREFDPQAMAKDLGPLQYHSGALRYYRDKGLRPRA